MKRVMYGANLINGINSLNRKVHQFCQKFIGTEFPTSGDYTVFYQEIKSKVEKLNRENPRCTPLKTSCTNDNISIRMQGRLNDVVASLEFCTIKAAYTKGGEV